MTNSAQTASAPLVLEWRDESVLTLTLNRPDKLNALNTELAAALLDSLRRAAQDDSVRCIILTGAGRAFCAGGDIGLLSGARRRNRPEELESLLRSAHDIVLALCDAPQPVVAAVNGPAAGGGMNLALACDILIAAEDAVFGQSFSKIGLFPDFGGTYILPKLVGPARAAELFITGDLISAADAQRMGIVNYVVPSESLASEARKLAMRLAEAPPLTARAVKRMLRGLDRDALVRALEFETQQQVQSFLSNDCLEGLTAFVEKRKPNFKGS